MDEHRIGKTVHSLCNIFSDVDNYSFKALRYLEAGCSKAD